MVDTKKPTLIRVVPFVTFAVVAGIFVAYALDQLGYLDIPYFDFPLEIKGAACIGVPYAFDFGPGMIPLLNPDWNGVRSGYTFYLGSGKGFPPMGLVLGIDGIMKGTPTGTGGNFEVCVKDVGGNSICRTIHLRVNSECTTTTITTITTTTGNCPIKSNPPCWSVRQDGTRVSAVIVYDYCNCPSDTYYSGTTDVVTPGGPYKICTCK